MSLAEPTWRDDGPLKTFGREDSEKNLGPVTAAVG